MHYGDKCVRFSVTYDIVRCIASWMQSGRPCAVILFSMRSALLYVVNVTDTNPCIFNFRVRRLRLNRNELPLGRIQTQRRQLAFH